MEADPNRPVVVAAFATEAEAALRRAALEEAGIPAWLAGGTTSGFRAAPPGRCEVLVRARDEARARAVLARLQPGRSG